MFKVRFLPEDVTVSVTEGTTLLSAQIQAGLHPDAPCGGKGTCGKCLMTLQDGTQVLSCQTLVEEDMTVRAGAQSQAEVLTASQSRRVVPDGRHDYCVAFDVGTTTVAGYLLDGRTGHVLAQVGAMNPQTQYGADVISRIQCALDGHPDWLRDAILECLDGLTRQLARDAGIQPGQITVGAVVGNTAMHHLLLGVDPQPLVTPPYMPEVREAMEVEGVLPIAGKTRMLPNIAGFVGGDTVGCMVAVAFDQLEELTLLIDIGTNGEMVLGDKRRRIACSTAAGPAFEGAKISCGMRGATGAVDHVKAQENGQLQVHVIGDGEAKGLCGSGLLDLAAALLDTGVMDESGYLENGSYALSEGVTLTQKDIRELQLAKAAIRAGIELLAKQLGVKIPSIRRVLLAGAFGNYLDPRSACRIGMIPPVLEDRIVPIGNAAGEGAKRCAVSEAEYEYSKELARHTEFLELAGLPEFQDRYVDALSFSEDEP